MPARDDHHNQHVSARARRARQRRPGICRCTTPSTQERAPNKCAKPRRSSAPRAPSQPMPARDDHHDRSARSGEGAPRPARDDHHGDEMNECPTIRRNERPTLANRIDAIRYTSDTGDRVNYVRQSNYPILKLQITNIQHFNTKGRVL